MVFSGHKSRPKTQRFTDLCTQYPDLKNQRSKGSKFQRFHFQVFLQIHLNIPSPTQSTLAIEEKLSYPRNQTVITRRRLLTFFTRLLRKPALDKPPRIRYRRVSTNQVNRCCKPGGVGVSVEVQCAPVYCFFLCLPPHIQFVPAAAAAMDFFFPWPRGIGEFSAAANLAGLAANKQLYPHRNS